MRPGGGLLSGRSKTAHRRRALGCKRWHAMTQAQAKIAIPNDLEPYWMPFTANRSFKSRPRLIIGAKDMHYIASDGRKVIDGSAGLWCTNAGHNREPIVAAIQHEAATLDYRPAFQFRQPTPIETANRMSG